MEIRSRQIFIETLLMTSDASKIKKNIPGIKGSVSRTHAFRGLIFMIIAVLFWGGSASLAKILIVTRFDTLIISQTRTTLAFILLLLFFLITKRSVFRVQLNDLWKLAVLGIIGVAVTNYTYYFTVKESSVATAILVQYTAPVWVVLYSAFIIKSEKLDRITIVSLVLALVGCDLAVTGGTWNNISLRDWAIITGPLSAFTYAYQVVGTKQLLKRYSVWTMLIYMFGFAALFWLFINPPTQIILKNYTVEDWGILWMFAIVSILIPQTVFAMGLKILNASTAGIIGIMEPVFAIVIAFFALGETLGFVQFLGALLVVAAVGLLQVHPLIMRRILKVE
jgi:drug/metabolite transporter (DMT)-like permease